MNREPIYHKRDKRYRVISMPNGKWQAQRLDESIAPSNQRDQWQGIQRPTTLNEAKAAMIAKGGNEE